MSEKRKIEFKLSSLVIGDIITLRNGQQFVAHGDFHNYKWEHYRDSKEVTTFHAMGKDYHGYGSIYSWWNENLEFIEEEYTDDYDDDYRHQWNIKQGHVIQNKGDENFDVWWINGVFKYQHLINQNNKHYIYNYKKICPWISEDIMKLAIKNFDSGWCMGETYKDLEFIRKLVNDYSKITGERLEETFNKLEKKRTYSWNNYYQKCNFPEIKKITLTFETEQDLRDGIKEYDFQCDMCNKLSSNPQRCTHCDFSASGLIPSSSRAMIKDTLQVVKILKPIRR